MMRLRLANIRPGVIITGVVSTVVALLLVFFVLGWLGSNSDTKKQRTENAAIARVLVRQLGTHPQPSDLAPYRGVLEVESQRAIVSTPTEHFSVGAVVPSNRPQTQYSVPFDGGTLTVTSPIDSTFDPPVEIVLVMLGVLIVVLGSVIAANRATNRETRRRVDEAVSAAGRVATGDYSVRVGRDGPEPLASLGSAFDSMASRLAAADREQREFLADLAHEIATPVQALTGFSQAVIDGTISKDVAGKAIASQSARLSEMLDELVQLQGLDAPDDGELEEVDLGALCRSLHVEFSPEATIQGVRLHCQAPHIRVRTGKRLVETVLRNFITNALRYTPSGQRITVSARRDRSQVIISVADTGPGIALEHQERIFDRFYRTAAARDRISGGTGLGLSIARGAAEAIGGHIELRSRLGQGSDFRLILPIDRATNSSQEDSASSIEPGLSEAVGHSRVGETGVAIHEETKSAPDRWVDST